MDQDISLLLPCLTWHPSFCDPRVELYSLCVSYLKAHFLKFIERLIGCVISLELHDKANDITMCSASISVNTTIEMRSFSFWKHGKAICSRSTEWTRTTFVNHFSMRPNWLDPGDAGHLVYHSLDIYP